MPKSWFDRMTEEYGTKAEPAPEPEPRERSWSMETSAPEWLQAMAQDYDTRAPQPRDAERAPVMREWSAMPDDRRQAIEDFDAGRDLSGWTPPGAERTGYMRSAYGGAESYTPLTPEQERERVWEEAGRQAYGSPRAQPVIQDIGDVLGQAGGAIDQTPVIGGLKAGLGQLAGAGMEVFRQSQSVPRVLGAAEISDEQIAAQTGVMTPSEAKRQGRVLSNQETIAYQNAVMDLKRKGELAPLDFGEKALQKYEETTPIHEQVAFGFLDPANELLGLPFKAASAIKNAGKLGQIEKAMRAANMGDDAINRVKSIAKGAGLGSQETARYLQSVSDHGVVLALKADDVITGARKITDVAAREIPNQFSDAAKLADSPAALRDLVANAPYQNSAAKNFLEKFTKFDEISKTGTPPQIDAARAEVDRLFKTVQKQYGEKTVKTAPFRIIGASPEQIVNKIKSMNPLGLTQAASASRMTERTARVVNFLASKAMMTAQETGGSAADAFGKYLLAFRDDATRQALYQAERMPIAMSKSGAELNALLKGVDPRDIKNLAASFMTGGEEAKAGLFGRLAARANMLYPASALDPLQRFMGAVKNGMSHLLLGTTASYPAVNTYNGLIDMATKGNTNSFEFFRNQDDKLRRIFREEGVTPRAYQGIGGAEVPTLTKTTPRAALDEWMKKPVLKKVTEWGTDAAQVIETQLSKATFVKGFEDLYHAIWRENVGIPRLSPELATQLTPQEANLLNRILERNYHYDDILKEIDAAFGGRGAGGDLFPPKPRLPHNDPPLTPLRELDPDIAAKVETIVGGNKTLNQIQREFNLLKNEIRGRIQRVKAKEPPAMAKEFERARPKELDLAMRTEEPLTAGARARTQAEIDKALDVANLQEPRPVGTGETVGGYLKSVAAEPITPEMQQIAKQAVAPEMRGTMTGESRVKTFTAKQIEKAKKLEREAVEKEMRGEVSTPITKVKKKPSAPAAGVGTWAPDDIPPLPYSRVLDEQGKQLFAELDKTMDWIRKNYSNKPLAIQPDKRSAIQVWLDNAGVQNELLTARTAGEKAGLVNRDFVLHDYTGGRFNFDTALARAFPYHYWVTREGATWAQYLLENPRFITAYSAYKNGMAEATKDLPPQYRDTVRIPFTDLRVNPELGFNPVNRWIDYIDLLQDPTQSTTAKGLGALRVMSPFPVLESGVRGAVGEESLAQKTGRLGQFAPVSRTIRGATALVREQGVGGGLIPPGGVDIESPLYAAYNRATGQNLSSRETYEPTYVGRVLYDMANKGEITRQEYEQAITQQSGATWDAALNRANAIRGVSDVTGFATGIRPRQVQESEFGIEEAKQARAELFNKIGQINEQTPNYQARVNALFDEFDRQYPFYAAYEKRYGTPEERTQFVERQATADKFDAYNQAKTTADIQLRDLEAQHQADLAKFPIGYKGADLDALNAEYKRQQNEIYKSIPPYPGESKERTLTAPEQQEAQVRSLSKSEPRSKDYKTYAEYQKAHAQWEQSIGEKGRDVSLEDVREYNRRNDTVRQAAESAWFDQYYNPLQADLAAVREKFSGKERALEERKVLAKYGEPNAANFADWIKQTYGDRWTDAELKAELAKLKTITADERRLAGLDEGGRLVNTAYGELSKIPPGKSDDFWEAVAEALNKTLKAEAGTGKYYNKTAEQIQEAWYSGKPEEIKYLVQLVSAIKNGVSKLGLSVPSDAVLQEWVDAEKLMAQYMAMPSATPQDKRDRKAFWDANELLSKYYSSDNKPTAPTSGKPSWMPEETWALRSRGGGGGGGGGSYRPSYPPRPTTGGDPQANFYAAIPDVKEPGMREMILTYFRQTAGNRATFLKNNPQLAFWIAAQTAEKLAELDRLAQAFDSKKSVSSAHYINRNRPVFKKVARY